MLVYGKHNLVTVVFARCVYIKLPLSLSDLVWVFNWFVYCIWWITVYWFKLT